MYEQEDIQERVILIGLEKNNEETHKSLDELEALAQTAGVTVIGRCLQKRNNAHPNFYVGRGKLLEIKEMAENMDATGVICDDELSVSQQKNMESLLQTKIMDRTMLILDIFASRALSSEGKIQVELAQLRYNLSHLAGIGKSLSRLGGGVGTRGPGEKKLEMDRRHIRERIKELSDSLQNIETHRNVLREGRNRKGGASVSLVGYTNAGKSTLLNQLSGADVYAEDQLFATLDTTTREVKLPGGTKIYVSDTVGFINKLPHQLIKAFKATLEELSYADILIHVADASNSQCQEQMEVVYQTLKELNLNHKPVITALNKIDAAALEMPADRICLEKIKMSARTGVGVEKLLQAIERQLTDLKKQIAVLIPYDQGNALQNIYGKCQILTESHLEKGVYIEAYMDQNIALKMEKYKVDFLLKS